jgi:hypothetical protein
MKNIKNLTILLVCSCLIINHFYNLSTYLINFASGGDDFLFLSYFNDLPYLHGIAFLKRTTEFHNYVHRFPFARLVTAIYGFFSDEFNFKELTIWANLFWLTIIYPIYQLFKRYSINYWHLIATVGLLFAPNSNLDNFYLIGILQHGSFLVFLVWCAYWISNPKTQSWGIWIALLAPLFSTEGLAFIPLVIALLMYKRDKRLWLFALLSALVIFLYFSGYDKPESHDNTGESMISKLVFTIQGVIVFVGSTIKKSFLISTIIGILFIGNTGFICWRYHQTKNPILLFSALILLQIMLTGAMITLGRGNALSGGFMVLFAERFYSYGTIFLVITYLAALSPELYPIRIPTLLSLVPAMGWIILSAFIAIPKLKNFSNRMVAEASNAYYFDLNTQYSLRERDVYLLKKSGKYAFPANILPIAETKNFSKDIKIAQIPSYDKDLVEFTVNKEGVLLVYDAKKPSCFFPINSLSHSYKLKKDVHYDVQTSQYVVFPNGF